MYAAHDAGQTREVQQWAPAVLADSVGMERRHVLVASTLADSFVPDVRDGSDGAPVDVEQACRVLGDIMVAARGLTSARGIEAINAVRRKLAPYAEMAVVKEIEHEFRSTVALIG
ncbi:hypothetical protein [Nocardia cyriacigeorgica]|uniref:hypothetical protein n=1 Tax=Nocardia cyriacigeorgica TaxID=135487 RepID=UPI0013D0FBA2|nr:hypothetical protein [Nocardia cyriacigeorgica]NEW28521.1 hypothetical protein [Nocardia cyriacigeorgica]